MTNPVTFLPGLMCDQRLWQSTWPLLSDAITPKHIQFALSPDIQSMASDVDQHLALAPHQSKQVIDLVGFSMGGYVALHYALNYPGKVKRLVIIAASAWGLTDEEQKQRLHIINYIKKNNYSGIAKQRIAQFVHPSHINDPVVDVIRDMDKSLGKETLVAQMQANTDRPSLAEQLNQLDIPVLIIGAVADQLVSKRDLQLMADNIPNGQLELLDHTGHMIPLEAPQQLAEQLNQFLV